MIASAAAAAKFSGIPLEANLDRLNRDGFIVLPNRLSPAEVANLKADLEPWFQLTPKCEGDFYGWNTTRIGGLLDKARLTQDLAQNEEILAIASAVIGANADCVQLNLTQAVRVHPGERAQAPHRDEEMWPAEKVGKEWLLNVMWAIDDFTEENGATRLWTGSHKQALDRNVDPVQSVAGVMRSGSALVFLGSLTHGAGANRSNASRTGIIISYCLGWLKQYENQFLAYPPSVVRTFPKPLQRLLGYQMHRPNLGGVDGQDPIFRLEERDQRRGHKDALPPVIANELAALYRNPAA